MSYIILNILVLLSVNQFSPMAKLDPKLSWYTLESNHFSVHFSNKGSFEEQENLAHEIVWYCEDVYTKLVPYMGWRPKARTNIVIADIYDYSSGWATPLPNNLIFICPTFQTKMMVNYIDWFEHLIIHEYTHILNMDMVHGIPGFFRKIFGRIITPNAAMPICFNEGLSVFNETKFTGLGRSRSSYHNMIMRSAILDKKIFPIDKWVTYELAQFPRGETPYFYGSMFNEYLADKYGDAKLVQYANWYSGGVPLFFNTQAKRVYGKSFYSLWRDFKKEMTDKCQNEASNIKQSLVTQTTQLTFEGGYTESPILSPDGNKIYYVSQNSDEYPAIKCCSVGVYPQQTNYRGRTRSVAIATSAIQVCGKTKTLIRKPISSPVRIFKDGSKLIFSIQDYYKNFYTYDDIYTYDIANRKLERITKGLRATDPDFSPTENKIAFIKNELGQTNLCIMDLDSNKITQLTNSDDYTQYSHPRFSPDGNKIAVAIWKRGGEQDIYIYDLVTDWILPITQDQSLDIQPTWSSNGDYMLFSSDRTGVFNIYAYNLKDRKLYQVTNVLTGAFEPDLSSDNTKLAFLLYSSKGYDIHITDIDLDSLAHFTCVPTSDSETIPYINEDLKTDTISAKLYHYNPFPSILPKFWLPLVTYDNSWSVGGMTYGADALFQHQYLIQATYDLKDKKPSIYANWIIDRYYPTIDISGYYDKGKIQGSLASTVTFKNFAHYQDLSLVYMINKKDYLMSGLSLSYGFSNAKIYLYSISPEQGRSIRITFQNYPKLLFSKYNLTRVLIGASEYINMPFRHHIFMLNLQSGFAVGETIKKYEYSLGGTDAQLKVRGYTDEEKKVQHALALTAEYRFPLLWIERGLGTIPIFFKNFSGDIFFDIGYDLSSGLQHPIKGIGCELSMNTLLFYEIPATLIIGIASNLSAVKINQIYFEFKPMIPLMNKY